MKRTPVYHKENERYRVVSVPGGLWQFQRHDRSKGYNHGSVSTQLPLLRVPQEVLAACKGSKVPHNDPWKPLARATEWLIAKTQLDTMVPPLQAA